MTVGARVERARGEVEVRAVGINLRFGFIGSDVVHFLGGLRLRERVGLLAEVGHHFLARGEAESGGRGNARLGVVTVGNGAVRENLGDALHAREAGVKVKVALLDLRFGGRGVHYVPENRGRLAQHKLFFDFFMRLETPSPISKKTPPRFPGQRRGVVFSPLYPIFTPSYILSLSFSMSFSYLFLYTPPSPIYKKVQKSPRKGASENGKTGRT